MKNLPNSKQILSIDEAAKYLGVSSKTLRRWESAGKLIPERTEGGHRRYSADKLLFFKTTKRKKRYQGVNGQTKNTRVKRKTGMNFFILFL